MQCDASYIYSSNSLLTRFKIAVYKMTVLTVDCSMTLNSGLNFIPNSQEIPIVFLFIYIISCFFLNCRPQMLKMSFVMLVLCTAMLLATPSVVIAAEVDSGQQCTYSFFFFTFRQPFAAKAVYDRVRLFYPTAPMVGELLYLVVQPNFVVACMSLVFMLLYPSGTHYHFCRLEKKTVQ